MNKAAVLALAAIVLLVGGAAALRARVRRAGAPRGLAVLVADGGAPLSAAPGGDTRSLPCGDVRCAIPREACCVYPFPPDHDPPVPAAYACVTGIGCPAAPIGPHGGPGPPTALRCAGTANCARGEVCCVRVAGLVVSSSCVDPDDCEAEREGERESKDEAMHAQLCDPAAGKASGCPEGVACSPQGAAQWQLPSTFGTCGVADEGPY